MGANKSFAGDLFNVKSPKTIFRSSEIVSTQTKVNDVVSVFIDNAMQRPVRCHLIERTSNSIHSMAHLLLSMTVYLPC